MTSKDKIFAAIRREPIPAAELPPYPVAPIRYADALAQFCQVLEQIGGRAHVVADLIAVSNILLTLPEFGNAQAVVNCVAGVNYMPERCVALDTVNDPHELEHIDVAILPGEFCVAENAAIWCTDRLVAQRVVYFLSQHVVIVVPRRLVNNMHEAYEQLSFGERGFGMFLAGPSKTADIEQSLVIGAHGARSLNVFIVGE